MAFIVHDFSDEHLYGPDNLRGVWVSDTLTFEVGWRRTVLGWTNLRLIGCEDQKVINMSPEQLFDLVPEASEDDALSGVVYMGKRRVEELGFSVKRREVIA